jgi:hypothetical protein
MEVKKALEYLQGMVYPELVTAYRTEYLEWKRTGVLQDGVIRNFYNLLSEDDEHVPITYAEKLFNERLAELFYLQNSEDVSLEDALRLMDVGFKVCHKYFTDDEFLYKAMDNKYYAEDGVCFDDWLQEKKGLGFEQFQSGWKVYN